MAMAALRHATRRLAYQRPPAMLRAAVAQEPRRLLHRGSSLVGLKNSLAEEQRWILQRLIRGGSPAFGSTYSRQFSSFHHGEPKPITFMDKAKEVYQLYDMTMDAIQRISIILLKLALSVAFVVDCCGSQYLILITRVMMGLEPQEWFLKDGKAGECHACGHALGDQHQKTE